jgi:hypothetical protein
VARQAKKSLAPRVQCSTDQRPRELSVKPRHSFLLHTFSDCVWRPLEFVFWIPNAARYCVAMCARPSTLYSLTSSHDVFRP